MDTGFQAGVTTAAPPVVTDFLSQTNIGATGELVSSAFDLGPYAAADLPAVYLDYTHGAGDFEIFMHESDGTETLLATTAVNPNAQDLVRRHQLRQVAAG